MNLKISKRHIITLWYETQMGDMKDCMKNQSIFADIMWVLYKKLKEKEND